GERIMIAFRLPRSEKISHETIVENLRALGFVRVMIGDEVLDLDDAPNLAGTDELHVIVDRLITGPEIAERLADAIGISFKEGEGQVTIVTRDGKRRRFSEYARCEE